MMPRSVPASASRTCCCWYGGKKSITRFTVSVASCVCSVDITRWPVSAAARAARTVSVSRISPIRITSGSWRSAARSADRKSAVSMPDLALVDRRDVVLVQDLDRVLDRDDVDRLGLVDVVDHRGERRGLARAGRSGHEDQPAVLVGDRPDRVGQTRPPRTTGRRSGACAGPSRSSPAGGTRSRGTVRRSAPSRRSRPRPSRRRSPCDRSGMMPSAIAWVSIAVSGSRSSRSSPWGIRIIGGDPTFTCRSEPWPPTSSSSQELNSGTMVGSICAPSFGPSRRDERAPPHPTPIDRFGVRLKRSGLGTSGREAAGRAPARRAAPNAVIRSGGPSGPEDPLQQAAVDRADELAMLLEEVRNGQSPEGDVDRAARPVAGTAGRTRPPSSASWSTARFTPLPRRRRGRGAARATRYAPHSRPISRARERCAEVVSSPERTSASRR